MDFHITGDRVIIPVNHESEAWLKGWNKDKKTVFQYMKMGDEATVRGYKAYTEQDHQTILKSMEESRMRMFYIE